MYCWNEQRFAIKFCFQAGLSATETLVLVQKLYGNEALNRSNVLRWYSRFRDGRELVEDGERCACPKPTRAELKIAAVAELVKNDHRIEWRMIAESLNIPKTVVLRILKEVLGKRKLCASFFFSQSLAPEQREDRVTSCQDTVAVTDEDKNSWFQTFAVFWIMYVFFLVFPLENTQKNTYKTKIV